LCNRGQIIGAENSIWLPEEAYLSGMLHNIGQLVLWLNFPKEYSSVVIAERDEAQLIALEEKYLGLHIAKWVHGW